MNTQALIENYVPDADGANGATQRTVQEKRLKLENPRNIIYVIKSEGRVVSAPDSISARRFEC